MRGGALDDQRPALGITPAQCLSYVFDQAAVACAVPGPWTADQMGTTLAYLEASEAEKD